MTKLDGLVAALILIGLTAVAAYLAVDEEVVSGLAEAIDGDSIRLDRNVIRIAGIDAPELRQTCLAPAGPYPCGDVARRALGGMVAGRIVTCRLSGHDRYGRRLASCEAAGEDLGAALVRRGFAVAYGRYQSEEVGARRQSVKYGRARLSGRRNGAKRIRARGAAEPRLKTGRPWGAVRRCG